MSLRKIFPQFSAHCSSLLLLFLLLYDGFLFVCFLNTVYLRNHIIWRSPKFIVLHSPLFSWLSTQISPSYFYSSISHSHSFPLTGCQNMQLLPLEYCENPPSYQFRKGEKKDFISKPQIFIHPLGNGVPSQLFVFVFFLLILQLQLLSAVSWGRGSHQHHFHYLHTTAHLGVLSRLLQWTQLNVAYSMPAAISFPARVTGRTFLEGGDLWRKPLPRSLFFLANKIDISSLFEEEEDVFFILMAPSHKGRSGIYLAWWWGLSIYWSAVG